MSPASVGRDTPRVEVVAAGNEVLLGDVLDTNTHWLCRRVTALGGAVTRTVLVRDELDAIAGELRGALQRAPQLVFTVGGLGPTADDMTLAGVALGLGVPLERHPQAERLVRAKYAEFADAGLVPFAEMNPSRLKMADLPRGAHPVANPVGGAPGVVTPVGPTTIVSLPGVPEELVAIVEQSLGEVFAGIFGSAHYEERVLVVDLQDESAIAGILADVERANPAVYVKSRAKRMGPGAALHITLSVRGDDAAAVDDLLAPPAAALLERIAAAGFAVREEPRGEGTAP
ncbi:MAG TPA: molybdopterin-binding protein [Thermoleophilia bacterium]|nr:molybdopterin-binding protein [Thermoleophilia bacterium]